MLLAYPTIAHSSRLFASAPVLQLAMADDVGVFGSTP